MSDQDKERADHEGSGGHSSERKRHQDREQLREGAAEPLLDREGEAAEDYAIEERAYSLDPDAKPADTMGKKTDGIPDKNDDPSRRRGERS